MPTFSHLHTSYYFLIWPDFKYTPHADADLPSLMTLSWVSWFHNLSHTLTSWQLIRHTFLKSQTPQNFGSVGFISKLDTDMIDSQLNPKKTLSGHISLYSFRPLLAYCNLPLSPNVQSNCVSRFKMATNKTEKLQNLNHKIDRDVYSSSFKVICNFLYP